MYSIHVSRLCHMSVVTHPGPTTRASASREKPQMCHGARCDAVRSPTLPPAKGGACRNMFSPTLTVIDAFVAELVSTFNKAYPSAESNQSSVFEQSARMALEALTNSDCSYHDINHTIMVTDVGQAILWGRLMSQGDVGAEDWIHSLLAMLYHDIGFVRGILKGDRGGRYIVNEFGDTAIPPPGATDAYMAPYHVTRSCLFVKERFATEHAIDAGVLIHNIEMTRFPVPTDAFYQRVGDYAGLVRAADLIGQMADPQYLQKLSRLYTEFSETGEAERLGYANAGELRAEYPSFFFERVRPYISEGLRYLRKTQEGQLWIANLFSHVYAEQHCEPSYGPERRLRPDGDTNYQRRSTDVAPPKVAFSRKG